MDFKNTINKNIKMCKALRGWINKGEYNFAATAIFNRPTTIAAANRNLVQWQCMVNKKMLGRRWKDTPESDRLFFIGIPEHPNTNLHYHMVVRAPVNPLRAQRMMAKLWKVAVPSGEMWISALDNIGDLARVATYATKDLWNGVGIEGFIVSE